jgi:hypothetical protein
MRGLLTVHGQKNYMGSPEVGGQHYDHTKLIVTVPFPRTRAESSQGCDAKEYQFGTHENYKLLKPIYEKNPKAIVQIDCEYEPVTNGIEIYEIYSTQTMKLVPEGNVSEIKK